MRKITFFTAALFAAFLVTSCDKPCDCDEAEAPVTGVPGNIIPLQVADSLYQNYGNSRVSLIEMAENITEEGDTIPKEDMNYKQATRLVSFSFAEMKKYMAYIEQQADSAGVEITELSVYFGKNKKGLQKDAGKATVFFNPAALLDLPDGTRDTVSFAILNLPDGTKKAVAVGTVLRTSEGMTEDGDPESLSGDMGHIAPPPPINEYDF